VAVATTRRDNNDAETNDYSLDKNTAGVGEMTDDGGIHEAD
jgi:hypothetical protein